MYNNLIFENRDHILYITINRPKQLNALNKETISELNSCLQTEGNHRVIILTGSGEKAFVAGADIKEFADFSVEEGKKLALDGQIKLFNTIENLHIPVIAAVNGFALGGGLELALASHIRVLRIMQCLDYRIFGCDSRIWRNKACSHGWSRKSK